MPGKWKIYNQDVIEWADSYSKGKFHALLCDPPYHLTTITKRFGKKNSTPAKYGTDGVFARSSAGFMGQTWDGGKMAFRPETWIALGEHLYDGAFGMAFSASRNWHRLAVAIEDAGFILHPTVFLWAYGSGFPKATRVKGHKEFDGHRYGLQALKPAVEPIIVFQKPFVGRPISNIMETGAGTLNIDASRISLDGMEVHTTPAKSGLGKHGIYGESTIDEITGKDLVRYTSSGRWPANFLLTEETALMLDTQSGIQKGGFVRNRTAGARVFNNNGKDTGYHTDETIDEPDAGASRFFYTVSSQLDAADPVHYAAKASRKERDAGLEEFELTWRGAADGVKGDNTLKGPGNALHPDKNAQYHNPHPTIKPIDLSRYLAGLLLPPDEYAPRRILVPFSGSGSEMIGAGLAGWERIVGVEFDTENGFIDIANARLNHWLKGE